MKLGSGRSASWREKRSLVVELLEEEIRDNEERAKEVETLDLS